MAVLRRAHKTRRVTRKRNPSVKKDVTVHFPAKSYDSRNWLGHSRGGRKSGKSLSVNDEGMVMVQFTPAGGAALFDASWVKPIAKKNPRKTVRRRVAKRNPQKTFRAKGKVVSFWAKKNPKHDYEVYVGNLGCVHRGSSKKEADTTYAQYVKASKSGSGRAGGEGVQLMVDGEPIKEHFGTNEEWNDNPRRRVKCKALRKRRKNPTFRTRSGETISFRAKSDVKKNPRRRKAKRMAVSKLRLNRRKNPAAKRSSRTGRFVKRK